MTFSQFFMQQVEEQALTPKEVSHLTGRSMSTVYRWLRGRTVPDIESMALLIRGLSQPMREKLLGWFLSDLPLHVEWADPSVAKMTGSMGANRAKTLAQETVIQTLSRLLKLIEQKGESAGKSDTLTPREYEQLVGMLDEIIQQLVKVKRLHAKRLLKRKQARPVEPE